MPQTNHTQIAPMMYGFIARLPTRPTRRTGGAQDRSLV